jgi:pyruvate formate lyase activating enzyme
MLLSSESSGIITHIQGMSIHDGPGIRSTIFLKGCNMRCKWCHNPETFSLSSQLEWIKDKCINCLNCIDTCPTGALSSKAGIVHLNRELCTNCFECIDTCYPEALKKIGHNRSVGSIYKEIQHDLPFIKNSSGGITISGGEPLFQYGFTYELLRYFKAHDIHTAIETNLSFPWHLYENLLTYVDLIIADIKILDNASHKEWTGISNNQILENIVKLDKTGKEYLLRTPVIPGVNNSKETIGEIGKFLSQLHNVKKFELLPYHPLANSKYKNLGMNNPFTNKTAISEGELNSLSTFIKQVNNGSYTK